MQGGKVAERIQYKDTASAAGIQKTMQQAQSGKYRQVQMRGTKETAEAFNKLAGKRGISKHMESTGISSSTTKRIGDTFTHQAPKMAHIGNAAKASAGMAAGLTAGVEVVKSIANGDRAGECANHAVSKSAESAVTAAASAAAAELTLGATGALLAGSAIPVVGPAVAALAVGLGTSAVVGEATEGLFDDLGNAAENIVDTVESNLGGLAEWAGSGIENAFDSIGNTVEDAVDTFFDNVERTADRVSDFFDSVGFFFGLF